MRASEVEIAAAAIILVNICKLLQSDAAHNFTRGRGQAMQKDNLAAIGRAWHTGKRRGNARPVNLWVQGKRVLLPGCEKLLTLPHNGWLRAR